MLVKNLDLTKVLVLDIETVSGAARYEDLSETMRGLWDIKSEQLQKRLVPEERVSHAEYYPQAAGIYAEFGKIVCISAGFFRQDEADKLQFRVGSYYDHDERVLLARFAQLLEKHYNSPFQHILCGHNLREFDLPYTCRRMAVQGINFPALLELAGKKPWEAKWVLDTMELWKFGDNKNFTALKLLCGIFGIPTPKDDIDGSEVGRVYWEEGDLDRIQRYCRKDVVATAQLLLRYQSLPLLPEEQIQYAD